MKKKIKKYIRIVVLGLFVIVATYFGVGDKYVKQIVSDAEDKIESLIVSDNETEIDKSTSSSIFGKITRVSDGDTVILTDRKGARKKIRLDGIDAPEVGQEYGDESTEFVKQMILNKDVRVDVIGIDKYDRILGVVHCGDKNVNEELLVNGLAWQYHYNKDKKYAQLVEIAKKQKLNIWSKSNSIDPYYWRKENK